MDTVPQISIIHSNKTEASRIIQIAIQISCGFFQSKKFIVLPNIQEKNPSQVSFPQLQYDKFPQFWQEITRINHNPDFDFDSKLVEKVLQMDIPIENLDKEINKLQQEWELQAQQMWTLLQNLFPYETTQIKSIEIRVTSFGTKMSYMWLRELKNNHLICYLRKDMSLSQIAEALIQCMLHDKEENDLPWEGSESIADFLVTQMVRNGIFQDYQPTINSTTREHELLLKESLQYLQSIHAPIKNITLEVQNNDILLGEKSICAQLSPLQQKILLNLYKKKNYIFSYDDLAQLMNMSDEDFSIWAINKNMQRLRTKLKTLGLQQDVIKIAKGRGYYLILD